MVISDWSLETRVISELSLEKIVIRHWPLEMVVISDMGSWNNGDQYLVIGNSGGQ